MDYIDWVNKVWRHVCLLWNSPEGFKKDKGFNYFHVLGSLRIDETSFTTVEHNRLHSAIQQALQTLAGVDLLRPKDNTNTPYYVISGAGEECLKAGREVYDANWRRNPDSLFNAYPQAKDFLYKLNSLAQIHGPGESYVYLDEGVKASSVWKALDYPALEGHVPQDRKDLRDLIAALSSGKYIRVHSNSVGDAAISPTFQGFLVQKLTQDSSGNNYMLHRL
ncbi:MAG: hypothetical protein M3014_05655 [Chloroflexota bacterium]|nr:hypothetical protein [Chloroflexota bacterium]